MSSIVNLELDQGTSKNILLTWLDFSTNLPMDLTGYTATLQVRRDYGLEPVELELTSVDNEIAFDAGPGTIVLQFQPTHTIDMTQFDCVYELVLTRPDGSKISFTRGKFIINQSITI